MNLTRTAALVRADARKADDSGDLIVKMAFASEEPYERWWGVEILDVKEGSVRLGRLNDGAAVLFNHNWNDLRGVHVADSVRCDKDGVLRGEIRLTAATQAGRDAIGLVDGGVLTKASVGYEIHHVVEQSKKKSGETIERKLDGRTFQRLLQQHGMRDGVPVRGDIQAFQRDLDAVAGKFERGSDDPPIYRVVDWEPIENSLVTIPADPTVGVGRGHVVSLPAAPAAQPQEVHVTTTTEATAGANAEQKTPVQLEQERKTAILNICRGMQLDDRFAQNWIQAGTPIEIAAEQALSVAEERGKTNPQRAVSFLDMGRDDTKRYSLMRALRAAGSKDWSKAGLELEASQQLVKKLEGRLPRADTAFFVPLDVMMRERQAQTPMYRDMTVASAAGGGYLVGTDLQSGSFIDLLRNTSVALRMGARRLSGLVGNVTIPKMSAGNTAYWLASESTAITESQPTIGQLALTPKNVAALTELSHQLMQQSTPDAEQMVLDSIARDIGLAVDVGILRGSGSSGEPTGIVTTSGIGAFTGTSLAAAGVLDAQADVATANALYPGCGYVTTPAVAALLMARPELPTTGTTRLWKGNMLQGSMFDMPAMSSAQMSAATMLFGWWQAVVLAEWGVLELMTNPFSDFTRGLTAVRGWYTCDVGVRYPAAFSYSSSIT